MSSRTIEKQLLVKDFFPYCQENDIGILVRGQLPMGILTGKFTPKLMFGEKDFRTAWQEDPME